MTTEGSTGAEGLGFGAKSNWIRAQPTDESVKSLRARFAEETGNILSENLVYAVRKAMKASPTKKKKSFKKLPRQAAVRPALAKGKRKRAVVKSAVTVGHTVEDQAQKAKNIRALRSAIFQLGMPVTEMVIADIKKEYYAGD
jgi:hypothetical protein